ncbi:hypothetical protein CS0771_48520 [Catellatospora sp. IY07-71]|nr:hypothetical protein CS0771_48520 [Catellatospora sp. IY07-71]
MRRTAELIARQTQARFSSPERIHIKANLFHGYEIRPLLTALRRQQQQQRLRLDAVMLGDSFLTTHLGYPSTVLDGEELQEFFLRVQLSLLVEIRRELDRTALSEEVYLIADMPHGSARHVDLGLQNAQRVLAHGADAIKIEVTTLDHLSLIEELSGGGVPVLAHLGYSPQAGGAKFVARTIDEARKLFRLAQQCRNAGAYALVLEGVATPALAALAAHNDGGLPVYAIFSGHAPYAGQSVNVWDALYRPPFPARYFPPTASLDVSTFPASYTDAAIVEHCRLLLELLGTSYPIFRGADMSGSEAAELMQSNPWC